ncbi:hypothetical protein QCA50_014274 [Cerrena zonata]|uniref:Protein S-acyltransferase n=1 Tax=Cerrena zonata TaxID=2478898 RepID=A0AAW0FTX9_9APHY
MICAQRVFQCCKWLERLGDKLTGAAGPVFVFLAVVLISTGTVSFFDIIAPGLPWPWLTIPTCLLIATNMFAHYYWVCTIPPGFVTDGPHTSGTGLLWAKKRQSARNRQLTGVQWSDSTFVTKAAVTKCRRCGEMRPEAPWPYRSPQMMFLLTYILAAVLCFAVTVMGAWHIWSVASGETSVEAHDHEHYRKIAKHRGEDFVNSYDLGKKENLKLFFNIGKDGYSLYTLFLPLRIEPYTDGRSWARRKGLERHHGIQIQFRFRQTCITVVISCASAVALGIIGVLFWDSM